MKGSTYNSKKWYEKRKHILIRDKWLDQVALMDGVRLEADTVHHILPKEDFPEYQWCDWNLISVNGRITHKGRLHEKFTGKLTKLGKKLMRQTAQLHGVKLKMLTMVIGMPASGKSTYAKQNLQGGLCYEMDAIASAFRLTTPHTEEPHPAARRMAAALRRGWLAEAPKYSDRLIVVRTAPDIIELSETQPDKLVVCTKQYCERPYKYDREEYQRQINEAVDWAEKNGVEIEYYPPLHDDTLTC